MSAHRTQVLAAVPQEKRARKVAKTWAGVALVAFGVMAALVSFAIMLRLVWTGASIDKSALFFVALPFVGGLFSTVLGAHTWSGELVSAGLKDIGNAVRVWRRNGNGGGS